MSILTPHINSHRAKAEAFGASAAGCRDEAQAFMFASLSRVHGAVADALEAGERELEAVYRNAPQVKGH